MAITGDQISAKEFKRSFRGYDEEEVDAFLDELLIEWEKRSRELEELKQGHLSLSERVAQYQGMEETLKLALVSAQKTAKDIVSTAQQRAEALIAEAMTDAQRITDTAEENARRTTEASEENARLTILKAEENARCQEKMIAEQREKSEKEQQRLHKQITDYRMRATEMLREQIKLLSSVE